MALHPLPGYALVELGSKYKHLGSVPTKSYDGATTGKLVGLHLSEGQATSEETWAKAVDKQVFWEELVTGTRVSVGDKVYVSPRIQDLRLYDDAE